MTNFFPFDKERDEMFNLVWVILAAFVLFGASYGIANWLDIDGPIIFGTIVLVSTLLVCGAITLIVLPSRSVGRVTCRNWGKNTGFATKFVIQNWSDTGTCLARGSDERWVPNEQIIINAPTR